MKLREYIEQLQQFIKDNPGSENLTVIYSVDDEGNYFHKVHYPPTLGIYEDGECFISHNKNLKNRTKEINAVCIN